MAKKLHPCRLILTSFCILSLLIYILFLSINPLNTRLRKPYRSSSSFSSSIPIPTPCLPSLSSSSATPLISPPPGTPPELLDYITFHRTARQCLLSPSPCPLQTPPSVLIFRNRGFRGGLGFRLGTIRWALLLAIATKRVLFIEWPRSRTGVSFDLTAALLPASVDWRLPQHDVKMLYARAVRRRVLGEDMEGGGNDSMVDSLGVMIRIGNITGAPKRRARLSLWLRSIDDGCNSENDDDMNNVVMEDDVNDGENSNDDDTDDFNDDNQDKVIEAEAQLQPPTVVNQSLPPISSFHALNTANLTLVLSPFPIVHAFLSFRRRLIRKLLFNPFHNTHSFPSLSSSHFDHDDTFVMSLERNLTRLLFRPSPVVSALARSRIPEENTGQGFVSVHVRTGDDVHEEKQRRMKLILRNMSVNAERMLDCAGEVHPFGKRTVFLASDSMGFKQVFMQQASKRGVNVYTQNIRPSVHLKNYGGSSQHSTSLFRFPFRFFPSSSSSSAESSVDVDRKCMQFLDVFADAIALGYGSGMVARLSSFASAALALGDTKRAVQIYLGLGQKQGECDVEQLAREERRVREAENTGRRGTKRRVKRDASMLHVLWYEDEDKRRIGRIGNRMQYVGHGNHVGLYAAEVFNMTSA